MRTLYDTIGIGYNATRQADPYLMDRIFHFLHPQADALYLDIGCGTGNYTIGLADRGLNFWGVEPSDTMLREAKNRSQAIRWLSGAAEQIPAPDGAFDGVIATLTIHHWPDLHKAFGEVHRVLKDDGVFIMFTSTPEQMRGYWLNHYFPDMFAQAMAVMPSFETIEGTARSAGLEIHIQENYAVQEGLKDLFLYSGKYAPSLYFNETIRNGISSFASLVNTNEVTEGLERLRVDMENGGFPAIQQEYENDGGDYLFLVAGKKREK